MAHDNLVLVMHPLGNHGPAYFKRYPVEFRQYTPTCDSADLGRCACEGSRQRLRQRRLRYTDHVLARAIDFLRTPDNARRSDDLRLRSRRVAGRKGLFLHGVPYAIAPKEQTQVPMAMWLSPGYADSFALAPDCLRQAGLIAGNARQPVSHCPRHARCTHRHPRPPPGPERCLQTISDTWLNADVNTDNIDPKYFCGEYLADRSCVSATRATLDAARQALRAGIDRKGMSLRVLLVEETTLLGDGIQAGLKLADYAVDWVRDGEAARLALQHHEYNACVLDLGLPKKDGLAVLKDLRGRSNATLVLVLTARDTRRQDRPDWTPAPTTT